MDDTKSKIISKHRRMKDVVFSVLGEDQRTRNDDKWLILETLKKIGISVKLKKYVDTGSDWIQIDLTTDQFFEMPSFETITRVRREIQNNDNNWLPTDPQVLFQRKIKEEAIHAYYADNHALLRQYQEIAYQVK